jgi:hypothetical protein
MISSFTPRPSQQNILRYTGGRLGIAAVPGAGKTHILSALAAQIIHSGALQDDQEVLIVTLVNSAVDNFEARIKRFFDNPTSVRRASSGRRLSMHGWQRTRWMIISTPRWISPRWIGSGVSNCLIYWTPSPWLLSVPPKIAS